MKRRRISTFITHGKLILMFVAFGILVSTATLLINIVVSTREILEEVETGIIEPMITMIESGDLKGDELTDQAITMIEDIDDLIRLAFPMAGERTGPHILLLTKNGEFWSVLFNNREDEKHFDPLSGQFTALLDEAETNPRFHTVQHLGPQSENVEMMVNIAPKSSGTPLVLSIIAPRERLAEVFRTGREELLALFGILVLISFVLGLIFSSRQVKSFIRLGDHAEQIARGNYRVRSTTKRKDEIGVLAHRMDDMAYSLEHRRASMESMNRIDRAVLGALSGVELTGRVARIISEQFDGAGVCILEFDGGSIRNGLVLSGAAPAPGTEDRIPWEGIPATMRSGIGIVEELDEVGLKMASRLLPPGSVGEFGLRVPLSIENHLSGMVVITSVGKLDDLDRDAMVRLSDQAGVALLHRRQADRTNALYKGSLEAMSLTVDLSSRWTHGHSMRVAEVADAILMNIGRNIPTSEETRRTLEFGCKLHDIGKISIDNAILDKPGRLTDEEFAIIRSHPTEGARVLADVPELQDIREIILYHHEHWDGSGYPEGRKYDAIPMLARITCIADVFEAVTADRPYRKGKNRREVRDFMLEQKGKLFDPGMLDRFIEAFDEGDIPMPGETE